MQKTKITRKVGGVIIIDGLKLHSPATIESNKPGRLKAVIKSNEGDNNGKDRSL